MQMLRYGLKPDVVHTFDAAAQRIAQENPAVYNAQLTEILAVQLAHDEEKRLPIDTAQIIFTATQPLKMQQDIQHEMQQPENQSSKATSTKQRRWKATIRCPKCKSDEGVFGYDKQMRSADEGAGRKFECMNGDCGHTWTIK